MKKIFKTFIKKINNLFRISQIIENQNILKIASGKQLSNYNKTNQLDNINDYEFRVFSQFGEDGIIQHLINKLDIEEKKFLEFGVESYDEANTRFLLENDDWEGLIIEGKKKDVNYIKNQPYYLKKRFNAVNHFVNKNNINKIIGDNNFVGKIGLLSIDIDGNDYWIWEAINIIDPSIVICEFNARFGYEKAVTIPYDEFFSRTDAHESSIYYGASLNALYKLGKKKNYELVATNTNGNNAFFIKKEVLKKSNIKAVTPQECFHLNSFSEFRDDKGDVVKKDLKFEQTLLNNLDLVEV